MDNVVSTERFYLKGDKLGVNFRIERLSSEPRNIDLKVCLEFVGKFDPLALSLSSVHLRKEFSDLIYDAVSNYVDGFLRSKEVSGNE